MTDRERVEAAIGQLRAIADRLEARYVDEDDSVNIILLDVEYQILVEEYVNSEGVLCKRRSPYHTLTVKVWQKPDENNQGEGKTTATSEAETALRQVKRRLDRAIGGPDDVLDAIDAVFAGMFDDLSSMGDG